MLGHANIENKINLTFYSWVKLPKRVLKTGLANICIRELIEKVLTFVIFLVLYTSKRNTRKASYTQEF